MRLIHVCAIGLLVGCGAEMNPPPPLAPAQREAIKQNLVKLGARVTADVPEGLYLSLRNTHVEIRELGGVVDGSRRTRNDVLDFCSVNEAVVRAFLTGDEFEAFRRWQRESLYPKPPSVPRAEYGDLKLTLSRAPLRIVFSRKPPSADGSPTPP